MTLKNCTITAKTVAAARGSSSPTSVPNVPIHPWSFSIPSGAAASLSRVCLPVRSAGPIPTEHWPPASTAASSFAMRYILCSLFSRRFWHSILWGQPLAAGQASELDSRVW